MSNSSINGILLHTNHRPLGAPAGRWAYYQEWNRALFLHWKVPFEALRKLVPNELNIDLYEGEAYVSVVAFTMEKIRPRYLPAIALVSDFDEINVRTYIDNDHQKGVFFLNIEAASHLSVFIAKILSGLPYEKASILRTDKQYRSINRTKGFSLDCEYEVSKSVPEKTALDRWLTERYCLYLAKGKNVFRYDIHHKEWELNKVKVDKLDLNYKFGDLALSNKPDVVHYAEGVQVLAWNRIKVHNM